MATSLAQSLAAGDPEAFAALYDRLASRLVNTARTMTGSIADAEDVVHDLFVDLARGRARRSAPPHRRGRPRTARDAGRSAPTPVPCP